MTEVKAVGERENDDTFEIFLEESGVPIAVVLMMKNFCTKKSFEKNAIKLKISQ